MVWLAPSWPDGCGRWVWSMGGADGWGRWVGSMGAADGCGRWCGQIARSDGGRGPSDCAVAGWMARADGRSRPSGLRPPRSGVAAGAAATHPSGVATIRPIGHSVGRTFLTQYLFVGRSMRRSAPRTPTNSVNVKTFLLGAIAAGGGGGGAASAPWREPVLGPRWHLPVRSVSYAEGRS